MSRRNETLSWLTLQARDHPEDFFKPDGLPSPESINSKTSEALEKGEIALDEDLAWELVVGTSGAWLEPEIPELQGMNCYEVAALLRLALELADDSGLVNACWLALRAHAYYASVNAGLGARDLPGLIDRLSFRHGTPLASVDHTLASLDRLIDSVDECQREIITTVVTSVVSYWTHYSSEFSDMWGPDDGASCEIMANWVTNRANEVIAPQFASYGLRLEAYKSSCAAIFVEANLRLRLGLLSDSQVSAWFESRISDVTIPTSTDPLGLPSPHDIASWFVGILAVNCGDWLVQNGSPYTALERIAWANQTFPNVFKSSGNRESAFVRASAYAQLGLVRKAIREMEGISKHLSPARTWAFGRLLCEAGNNRGLEFLRSAVGLPEQLDFREARVRMRILLAEKEIESGNPKRAVRLVRGLGSAEDTQTQTHAKVVLAEAILALARNNPEPKRELLDNAGKLLRQLNLKHISDTPDRIVLRILAALGEIALTRGRGYIASSRSHLRDAMDELERGYSNLWHGTGLLKERKISPDNAPDQYWRRPWSRNWTRVAEMCLLAELEEGVDVEIAFPQLQKYRTITHAGTISKLAGFAPEASLGAAQRRLLEGLRSDAEQMRVQIKSLREEVTRVETANRVPSSDGGESLEWQQHLETIYDQLREKEEKLWAIELKQGSIQVELNETRGYMAGATGIRPPEMCKIRRHLAEANAAVVELLRVDGTQWGKSTKWFAFVVTPDGVTHVQLPAEGEGGIDRELRLLRSNRERLDRSALSVLSDLIVGKLPARVFRYRNLFIAADGDTWAVPFRSLARPRWRFVPRRLTDSEFYANWPVPEVVKGWMDSLSTRLDSGVVTNVISTTHLIRLIESSQRRLDRLGVVVGSSGNSGDRILCQGLARSLEVQPPSYQQSGAPWKRYSGSLAANTPQNGDRPEWMHGTSEVFLASWHTTFTDDPTSVALFHFDDDSMTLAEFLSRSNHESNIAVILSCNISRPPIGEVRAFSMMGSCGFGIMEALRANAIVATTNEVTAEVAFMLGRLLSTELTRGNDLHTALANSQRNLRKCKVVDVISRLKELESTVPETAEWLRRLGSADPDSLAFPKACDTEPFYILGLPDVRMSKFN